MSLPDSPGGLVPEPDRTKSLERVRRALESASRVAIATHLNADGDGAGSELAMAAWLRDRGIEAAIVNPTPFPDAYAFLLEGEPAWTPADPEGRTALERADLALVLDTSEPSRLGRVAGFLDRVRVAVIDHHPASPDSVGDVVACDPSACATGELVYDLIALEDGEVTPAQARSVYAAIVTDTGSFRYGNTTPRAHRLTALLLEAGVDVEAMFRELHAGWTPEGLALLRRVLETLTVDPELPIAWLTLRQADLEESEASFEDREGLISYARRLRGIEVAVLFRELPGDRTKVSLRSNVGVDVAEVARELGGGGHPQASGALMERPLEEARSTVLERLRAALRARQGGSGGA